MIERVRVAVAGLGAVAQSVHLPLLARRWDLFDVAAVADLSPSLREQVGAQYGVPPGQRYADVAEMISSARADAVVLLTSGSHGKAAVAAIREGLPVFCEKPLAYSVAEADELAAAEKDAGRPMLLLAYMKERDDAVVRLERELPDPADIRAVEVCVLHPTGESQLAFANLRPPAADADADALDKVRVADAAALDAAIGSETSERFRRLYSGVVVSSLVHDISLVRRLFGGLAEIDDVRAWPDEVFPPSVEVSGRLVGGARARLSWHYLPDYPAYRETLAVHHARGSATVTFGTPYLLNAPTTVEHVRHAPAHGGTGTARGCVVTETYASIGESFENELVEFHAMVTAQTPPVSGVAEGRADVVTSQRILAKLAQQAGANIGGEAAGGVA